MARKHPTGIRQRSGFTLVELMVAMVLLSLVILLMFQAFNFQAKTYEVVSGISESQQTTTMLSQLLERDLRNAGYMVSDAAVVCGSDKTNGPDMLFVSDSAAIADISFLASLEPDQSNSYIAAAAINGEGLGVRLTAPSSDSATGTAQVLTLADLSLDTDPTYSNDADATSDSDFQFQNIGAVQIRGGVIVRNTTDSQNKVACGVITAVDKGNKKITVDWKSASISWVLASNVIVVPAHVYEIVPAVAGISPARLQRNGLTVANHVEDLQIEYLFDLDDDGIAEGNEWRGVTGSNYSSAEASVQQLVRNVRVTLAVTSPLEDATDASPQGRPQDIANHDVTGGGFTADNLRRRFVTSMVYPRNVGNELEGE